MEPASVFKFSSKQEIQGVLEGSTLYSAVTTLSLAFGRGKADFLTPAHANLLYSKFPNATTLEFDLKSLESFNRDHFLGSEHFSSIRIEIETDRAVSFELDFLKHHSALQNLTLQCSSVIDLSQYSFDLPMCLRCPTPVAVGMSDFHLLPQSLVELNMDMAMTVLGTTFYDILSRPALLSLSVRDLRLQSLGECQGFARGLNHSNLKYLKLLLRTHQDQHLVPVLEALENMSSLEYLELQASSFHFDRIRGHPHARLDRLLRSNARLKELKVQMGEIPMTPDEAVAFSLRLSERSCCLERLDLAEGISSDLVCTLLSELRKRGSSCLKHLSISDYGGKWDARAVVHCVENVFAQLSLRSLTLKGHGEVVPPDTAGRFVNGQALLAVLSKTFTLESIDLDLVDPDSLSRMQSICRLNAAGRGYLKTAGSASRKVGVEVLSKVKDDLDDLYTHLVENPGLCTRVSEEPSEEAVLAHPSKRLRTKE